MLIFFLLNFIVVKKIPWPQVQSRGRMLGKWWWYSYGIAALNFGTSLLIWGLWKTDSSWSVSPSCSACTLKSLLPLARPQTLMRFQLLPLAQPQTLMWFQLLICNALISWVNFVQYIFSLLPFIFSSIN